MNDCTPRSILSGSTGEGAPRGTHTPDIRRLLAVLAARQRILPTARAMRGADGGWAGQATPDCMVRLFAGTAALQPNWGGSFNRGTAQFLSRHDGENGVYRGA